MTMATSQLADHHYRHWKSVFENLTGVQVGADRESLARTVLRDRLTQRGADCFESYFHDILDQSVVGREEWQILFEKIVIGETQFFRHRPSFDFLNRHLAHELKSRGAVGRDIKAWSVGCSTGEEAYSLAMVLDECCGVDHSTGFGVVATDIKSASLQYAQRAIFPKARTRGIGEGRLAKFFEPLPEVGDRYRVRKDLRAKVAFSQRNILNLAAFGGFESFDIIFCQNVLIYFHHWRRRAVVRGLVEALSPGGVLILGPGELVGWKPEALKRIPVGDIQAYRRMD